MKRTLIKQTFQVGGEKILIKGRIINIRSLGKIIFIIVQDYTGIIQTVWEEKVNAKIGDVVAIEGIVKKEARSKGGFEIQGEKLEIVSSITEDFPVDLSKNKLNLSLAKLLDYRPLSLRHPKIQAIFK